MFGERLIDLDEMVLRCRDEQAQQYIAEAVACYKAGAFRACIVSTWIAIVYDFIHKLRELELTGDKNAIIKLKLYEDIRSKNDIRRSLDFERQVLDVALKDFEFISSIEHEDLTRLLNDRNRCAHPLMQMTDEPYYPSAELARCHLRNAITYLLQHPPVQGQAALDSIWKDIRSAYFPTETQMAIMYFKNGPLGRARQPLIRNMIIGLTKDLLQGDRLLLERLRQFAALNAVITMYRSEGERIVHEQLPKVVDGVSDGAWHKVISYIRHVPIAWEVLGDAAKNKARNFIMRVPLDEAAPVIGDALHISSLNEMASSRICDLPLEKLAEQIQIDPRPEYIEYVIRVFSTAESFKSSDFSGPFLCLPLVSVLSIEQVKMVIRAYGKNDQLYRNGNIIAMMREVFLKIQTKQEYVEQTKQEWLEVYHRLQDFLDPDLKISLEDSYPEAFKEEGAY